LTHETGIISGLRVSSLGIFRGYRIRVASGTVAYRGVTCPRRGVEVMNKDRIEGAAKEAKGSVKETIGKAVGDAKLRSDGKEKRLRARSKTLLEVSRTRSGNEG
jgi:uncharacterized protein YjbJ (UPF0337 family)